MSEKGNVYLHCGKVFKNVAIDIIEEGCKVTVFRNEKGSKHPENVNTDKPISCFGCPCKRVSGREQGRYFTDEDTRENRIPTGVYIVCKVARIEQTNGKD